MTGDPAHAPPDRSVSAEDAWSLQVALRLTLMALALVDRVPGRADVGIHLDHAAALLGRLADPTGAPLSIVTSGGPTSPPS